MGRKRRPAPPARTAKRLRTLFEKKQRADETARRAADELAAAVLRACEEEGATRAWVAEALGVGTSTVQGWVERGRQIARETL